MKKRTVFLAVSGENDRSFDKYDKACEWLDKISPVTATRGFTCEDHHEDDEMRTIVVRHAETVEAV